MRKLLSLKNLIILVVIVGIGVGIYFLVRKPPLAEGLIQVNGRMEGDTVVISSKYNGKIERLLAREGNTVTRGQTVAALDDPETRARLAQAQRAQSASVAAAKQAGTNVSYTSEVGASTIEQARGQVQQASDAIKDAQAAVVAARSNVRVATQSIAGYAAQVQTAQATLQSAQQLVRADQAQAQQSATNAQRYANLAREGTVTQQVAEQYATQAAKDQAQLASATANAASAQSDLAARQSDLARSKQTVATAQADLTRAQAQVGVATAKKTQAEGILRQAQTAPIQVAMSRDTHANAQSQVAEAQAKVQEQAATLQSLFVTAPITGMVTTRVRDVGEVVTAGSPILEVVDLDRLYLKAYVPENQIGRIRLGLPAQVYVDAYPGKPFDATVRYISSTAEFTPKEVQTPDERVKLVYAVKLYLNQNPDHRLTPGMPADAIVRWKEGVPWQKPRY